MSNPYAATASVYIDSRYNGPPDSGNGGYVCGIVAQYIAAPVASVRLMAPPPLDTPLTVSQTEDGVSLMDGARAITVGRAGNLDVEAPPAPSLDEAGAAAKRFRGFEEHVFPDCFVCGPSRAEGDGLRIFAGAMNDRDLVAAPWTPHASLAGKGGCVRSEIVWSALDCPGAFSFPQPEGRAVVLGEFTVRIDRPVKAEEAHTVIAWPIDEDGRKHWAGSAVYDAEGQCCAIAKATWIEVAL